jgi:hypothetical protein
MNPAVTILSSSLSITSFLARGGGALVNVKNEEKCSFYLLNVTKKGVKVGPGSVIGVLSSVDVIDDVQRDSTTFWTSRKSIPRIPARSSILVTIKSCSRENFPNFILAFIFSLILNSVPSAVCTVVFVSVSNSLRVLGIINGEIVKVTDENVQKEIDINTEPMLSETCLNIDTLILRVLSVGY